MSVQAATRLRLVPVRSLGTTAARYRQQRGSRRRQGPVAQAPPGGVAGAGFPSSDDGAWKEQPPKAPSSSGSKAGGGQSGGGVLGVVREACAAYDRAVKANPILTKALTSFVGFALGDRIAQSVVEGPYDVYRAARLSLYGLLLDGPVGHAWYKLLDRHVYPEDPTCNKAVLIKTALDQLVWGPVMGLVFFLFLAVLEGHPETFLATVRERFIPMMAANYVLWPLAHLVNFKFVPTDFRILFNNTVAIFWTTYLSYTCGPAATGSGGIHGGMDPASTAAAATSALLSTFPCKTAAMPGSHGLVDVQAALSQLGSKSFPSADSMVEYLQMKAQIAQRVCQQSIRLPPS